jgi:hypothetical protein
MPASVPGQPVQPRECRHRTGGTGDSQIEILPAASVIFMKPLWEQPIAVGLVWERADSAQSSANVTGKQSVRNAPKRLSVGAMYAKSNAASALEAAFDATYLVQGGDEPNGTANILRDAPLTDSDQDAAGILDPRPSVSGFGGRVYARRPASGFGGGGRLGLGMPSGLG